jgi:hypothetical protein
MIRRRSVPGSRPYSLARLFRVSRSTIKLALYGEGPYARVSSPPPLRPPGKGTCRWRLPSLTNAQVGEARRLRRSGLSLPVLLRRYRVSRTTLQEALLGKGVYRAFRRVAPLQPRSGGPPGLSPERVREARRRAREGERRGGLAEDLGVSTSTLKRALYGLSPYGSIRTPAPLPRLAYGGAPLSEEVWARRRRIAMTCITWNEYAAKLGVGGVSVALARRHGVRLLCAICRRRPATERARGNRSYRAQWGEMRTAAAFVQACAACAEESHGSGRGQATRSG